MGFRLYGQASGGVPVAGVISQTVSVASGLFTVALDFGPGAFGGSARWLDITVRCPAGSGAFATLSPRQALTAAPYALYAMSTGALAGQPLGGGAPANGQVLKWNGAAWVPGTDNTGGGGGAWLLAGNAGTSLANFLGITDNMTLTLAVSGTATLRLVPNATSANVIGGSISNTVAAGVVGVTIGGGGDTGDNGNNANRANGNYATVAGGQGNTAGSDGATVAGGRGNAASGLDDAVGGGFSNSAANNQATVGGGNANSASGALATVGGGGSNQATAYGATVSGGGSSTASGLYGTVGGGNGNLASGPGATVGGGGWDGSAYKGNIASGNAATVGGGWGNVITTTGSYATVSGGRSNAASAPGAAIGGGQSNLISTAAIYATVSGGLTNTASGAYASVSGGIHNTAAGQGAMVGGGDTNTANNTRSVVGGGNNNVASGFGATVSGGSSNTASGVTSVVAGGSSNTASEQRTTVAGGEVNHASGYAATVGGGGVNTASQTYAIVAGGYGNTASGQGAAIGGGGWDGGSYDGNTASGNAATVPGGWNNSASGNYSFAAGRSANAANPGAFVWADSTGAVLTSTTADEFLVRASGGVTLYSNSAANMGVTLAPGAGSWSSVSDRNLKANFSQVDDLSVLAALAAIPMQTWNYTSQDAGIRHLGPMAQDFRAAFGLGENDTTISTVDAQGVALAGVQGLYHLAQDQAAQLKNQQTQIDDLKARLAAGQTSGASGAPLPWGWLMFGGLLLLNVGGAVGYALARGKKR